MNYYTTWSMEDLLLEQERLSENITFLNRKDKWSNEDQIQMDNWREQSRLVNAVISDREQKADEYRQKYNPYLEI